MDGPVFCCRCSDLVGLPPRDDHIFQPGRPSPTETRSRGVDYSNGEINLCDMRLPPPGAGKVVPHPVVKKFYIPDDIPGEKVEDFFQKTKSDFEMYRCIPTVNLDERTITLSEFDQNAMDKWYKDRLPLNKKKHEVINLSVPFDEKRENRVKDAWRFVQSQLAGVGLSSILNLAECCMEVATTTNLDLAYKARHIFRLLSTTSVPSFMVLEIFEGSRQHKFIEIGPELFGISKDVYRKRWKCLFRDLKELSKRACSHLFLNENSFTAVTTTKTYFEELEQLPKIVEDYFVTEVGPANAPVDCSSDGFEDPHSKLEAFALYTLIQEKQAIKLQTSFLMVARSLYGYKISYDLNPDDHSMEFSSIKSSNHPDVINNAGLLFELLSRTYVPASMAIEVLDGCLQAYLIKIGSQLGGLCSKHGITNEDYIKRWKCLHYSLEELAKAGHCNVFLDENTVAVVCDRSYGLRLIELFVEACIVRNECPGNTARIISILRYGLESIEDPHVKHMQMETSGSLPDGLVKAASFHAMLIYDEQDDELIKDWADVESCLKGHDISSKLIKADSSLLVSVTTKNGVDDNIIDKTWDFVHLLSANVPASKAIKVVDGHLHCSIIRTMYPPGVLRIKFGISMGIFVDCVRPRYESALECYVEGGFDVDITNNEHCVAVVGCSAKDVERVARVVLDCFALQLGHPSLKRRRFAHSKVSQVYAWESCPEEDIILP